MEHTPISIFIYATFWNLRTNWYIYCFYYLDKKMEEHIHPSYQGIVLFSVVRYVNPEFNMYSDE